MLDSWSPFHGDYEYGNSYDFGKFDQCLSLKNSQHCLIQYFYKTKSVVSIPPPITIYNTQWTKMNERFGGAICVPASCKAGDIEKIMNHAFGGSDLVYSTDYDQEFLCVKSDQKFKFGFAFWVLV